MGKARMGAGLLVSCLLAWAGSANAAAPTVAQMLGYRPKRPGVAISTPTAAEQEHCKVELIGGGSGWMLRDAQGHPLRRFYASGHGKRVNVYSYYMDGVEVYREIDAGSKGVIDQYRWLNAGGMKWGIDSQGKGRIDSWRMISAEEVSQEAFQALITNDMARFEALLITDADIKTLELPNAEADRLRGLRGQVAAKFQSTAARLKLGSQARWERLESGGAQCIPGDQSGAKHDSIQHHAASILYEDAGKHDWIQIGDIIQVGLAWRLVDAPTPGSGETAKGGDASPSDPVVQAAMEELRKLDAAEAPKGGDGSGQNPAIAAYNMKRANVLQKIVDKVTKAEDRDQWLHQLADSLSAAAQASSDGDKAAYGRLLDLEKQVVKAQPGSALAGYVTFREMSAEYAGKLTKPTMDFAKVQEQWIARLTKFVQDYPQAEDAPDALLQLGMVSEFLGKEIEAKKWYQQLATQFADKKPLADKAVGALRRLDVEGKPLELAGTTLDGKSFTMATVAGKVVVVYYWASWNQQSVGDFARLKLIQSSYASKGVEIVCINLDNAPPAPGSTQAPGIQLYQPGGLDSPLATHYGIMVLPNLFLVNREGKVASRTVQLANLEEEIKKLVK